MTEELLDPFQFVAEMVSGMYGVTRTIYRLLSQYVLETYIARYAALVLKKIARCIPNNLM
jgi:hypothetical protein